MLDVPIHSPDFACLSEIYSDFVTKMGTEGVAYFSYGTAIQVGRGEGLTVKFDHSTFPGAWMENYRKQDYMNLDPVLVPLFQDRVVSRWTCKEGVWPQTRVQPTSKSRMFFEDAERHAVHEGVAFVVARTGYWRAFVSLAFSSPVTADVSYERLQLLAFQLHLARGDAEQRLSPFDPIACDKLTPRESNLLDWVAKGKSSWEIGQIIGISENTINFHLKSAMQKLGVSSRAAAIMKAHKLGFIN